MLPPYYQEYVAVLSDHHPERQKSGILYSEVMYYSIYAVSLQQAIRVANSEIETKPAYAGLVNAVDEHQRAQRMYTVMPIAEFPYSMPLLGGGARRLRVISPPSFINAPLYQSSAANFFPSHGEETEAEISYLRMAGYSMQYVYPECYWRYQKSQPMPETIPRMAASRFCRDFRGFYGWCLESKDGDLWATEDNAFFNGYARIVKPHEFTLYTRNIAEPMTVKRIEQPF